MAYAPPHASYSAPGRVAKLRAALLAGRMLVGTKEPPGGSQGTSASTEGHNGDWLLAAPMLTAAAADAVSCAAAVPGGVCPAAGLLSKILMAAEGPMDGPDNRITGPYGLWGLLVSLLALVLLCGLPMVPGPGAGGAGGSVLYRMLLK